MSKCRIAGKLIDYEACEVHSLFDTKSMRGSRKLKESNSDYVFKRGEDPKIPLMRAEDDPTMKSCLVAL